MACAALCEPQSAEFVAQRFVNFKVAGAALCEPQSVDFVAGAALCEPRRADFVQEMFHDVEKAERLKQQS